MSSDRLQFEDAFPASESVDAADAYAFVMPEYNYFPPPSLVNALDYLVTEWTYKPAGLWPLTSVLPTGNAPPGAPPPAASQRTPRPAIGNVALHETPPTAT